MRFILGILRAFLSIVAVSLIVVAIVISYTPDCPPPERIAADADTMKAVVSRCYGGPEVLEYRDVEVPVPEGHDLLIEVRAAAVNPLDYHFMRGSPYLMRFGSGIGRPKNPRIGVDFAGVVVAIGDAVTRFSIGDAVFGGHAGAFAEYLVIPESFAVAAKPDNVSFEEAAAIPIAAITALQALRDHGNLEPGEKVLINGASGGVGTYAVQIARSMGAEVHGVCSTPNVDMVRALGADHVFDYRQEDYTGSGNRYDLIVDMVGNHSLTANRGVLAADGSMILVGGDKGNWIAPFVGPLKALLLSPFIEQDIGLMIADMRAEDLVVLAELMANGQLTSRIDTRYALANTADALRYLETRRARGKVIIDVDGIRN